MNMNFKISRRVLPFDHLVQVKSKFSPFTFLLHTWRLSVCKTEGVPHLLSGDTLGVNTTNKAADYSKMYGEGSQRGFVHFKRLFKQQNYEKVRACV